MSMYKMRGKDPNVLIDSKSQDKVQFNMKTLGIKTHLDIHYLLIFMETPFK